MKEQELIELLADKEHVSWSSWMTYFLGNLKGRPEAPDDLIIPAAYVEALQKQINMPYEQLSEQEKQYDRDEVMHILPIIKQFAKENNA